MSNDLALRHVASGNFLTIRGEKIILQPKLLHNGTTFALESCAIKEADNAQESETEFMSIRDGESSWIKRNQGGKIADSEEWVSRGKPLMGGKFKVLGEYISVVAKKGNFAEDDDVVEVGLLPTKESSLVLRILRCREQIKEALEMLQMSSSSSRPSPKSTGMRTMPTPPKQMLEEDKKKVEKKVDKAVDKKKTMGPHSSFKTPHTVEAMEA